MPYTAEQLRAIYDKTDGHCHFCHRKLSRKNYGAGGKRGAWEVEHSRPRARGGTDHGNNLYATCITCNRNKSDYSTRTARRRHGTSRAPFSKEEKGKMRVANTLAGAVIGGLVGSAGAQLGVCSGQLLGRPSANESDRQRRDAIADMNAVTDFLLSAPRVRALSIPG